MRTLFLTIYNKLQRQEIEFRHCWNRTLHTASSILPREGRKENLPGSSSFTMEKEPREKGNRTSTKQRGKREPTIPKNWVKPCAFGPAMKAYPQNSHGRVFVYVQRDDARWTLLRFTQAIGHLSHQWFWMSWQPCVWPGVIYLIYSPGKWEVVRGKSSR